MVFLVVVWVWFGLLWLCCGSCWCSYDYSFLLLFLCCWFVVFSCSTARWLLHDWFCLLVVFVIFPAPGAGCYWSVVVVVLLLSSSFVVIVVVFVLALLVVVVVLLLAVLFLVCDLSLMLLEVAAVVDRCRVGSAGIVMVVLGIDVVVCLCLLSAFAGLVALVLAAAVARLRLVSVFVGFLVLIPVDAGAVLLCGGGVVVLVPAGVVVVYPLFLSASAG